MKKWKMQTLNLIGIWKRQQPCTKSTRQTKLKDGRCISFFPFSICFLLQLCFCVYFDFFNSLFNRYRYRNEAEMQFGFTSSVSLRFQKNALFSVLHRIWQSQMIIKAWDWSTNSIVWNFENDLTHIFILFVLWEHFYL